MKLVFCDMPMAQAQKFLKTLRVVPEGKSAEEFDFRFGYTVLRSLVGSLTYDFKDDRVYLVNSTAALQVFYEDIVSDVGIFADVLYFLTVDCTLHACKSFVVGAQAKAFDADLAEQMLDNLNKEAGL